MIEPNSGSSNQKQKAKRQNPVRNEGEKSLANLFPAIATQWCKDRNAFPPTHVRPGSNRAVWWICEGGHIWLTTPYVRTKGHGCATCQGMKPSEKNNLASARPDLVATWHDERNSVELRLSPTAITAQSNRKVWWICPRDTSHEYKASPAARFRGSGCPFCAGKQVDSSNSVAGVRPLLATEWDPENEKGPGEVAYGSDYRASWICRVDSSHRWEAVVSSRPADGAGCPFCSGRRPTDENRLSINRPQLAQQWHPTKNGTLTPADVSVGSRRRVWWVCPQNSEHVWSSPVAARARDQDGCKWCAPALRSRIDVALACEFEAAFPGDVNPQRQRRLDLGHNRPHTVDILIESYKIIVEFDGSYSHQGKSHEQRDASKTKKLWDAGFRVTRIREAPLPLLDQKHDIAVSLQRVPDARAITTAVLRHMVGLDWIRPEITAAYLKTSAPDVAEKANQFYESLPQSEKFVPLSARAARKRKETGSTSSSALF